MDVLEEAFWYVVDYCNKNNTRKLPWKITDFVKQTEEEGKGLIPVDNLEPRQNKINKVLGI